MPDRYRSISFWLPLIAAAGLIALGVVVVRWTSLSAGAEYGGDFGVYRLAAERAWTGQQLYLDHQLAGPYDAAMAAPNYLYPPPFAGLMGWSLWLPARAGAAVWSFASVAAAIWACYLAARAGGAPANRFTLASSIAAAAWFGPLWLQTVIGNVSSWTALAVAGALWGLPRTAALATTAGAVLKLTPGLVLPALLLARPRAALVGVAIAGALLVPSFVLQFDDWLDFPVALRNLAGGAAAYETNLNIGAQFALHFDGAAASIVGPGALVAAVMLLLASAWWGRAHRLPLAIAAATVAGLLLPAALWYHYLLALLPLGVMLFVRSAWRMRAALLIAHAAITLAWLLGGGLFLALVTYVACALLIWGWWRSVPREATMPAAEVASYPAG